MRIVSTIRDPTRPNGTESALHEAEHRYRRLVEFSPDAMLIHQDLKYVYVNRACVALLGATSSEELLGRSVLDFTHPDSREAVRERIRLQLDEGKTPSMVEQTYLRADGSTVQVEVSSASCLYGGKPAIQAIARDITERKRSELSAAESRTRLILESALDAVVVMDDAGRITDWNAQAENTFGWSRTQVIGIHLTEIIVPARYREAHHQGLRLFLETGEGPILNKRLELSAMHRDGHEFPVELTISPVRLGGAWIFSSFIRDLTEHRKIEKEIYETRNFLASIFDNIPNSLFVKDARDLRFVRVNAACEKLTGFAAKELLGKSDYDLFPKAQADFFVAKDRETLAATQQVFIVEETITSKDGTQKRLQTKKFPVQDKDGHPQYLLGMSEDITERVHTESRLRESEAKYRGLIEQASDGIFITDARGYYLLVNSRACELLGFGESEMIGMHGSITHLEDDREAYSSRLQSIAEGNVLRYERMMKRKDGSVFASEVSAKKLSSDSVQFIFRDVTERNKVETRLRESEARFRSFAEQSPDAMIIHQAGNIVFANDAMVRLLRAGEASTLLGKPGLSLVQAGHADIAEQRRARLYSGLTVPLIDQVYLRLDGTPVDVEVASSPIVLDGQPAALVTVRDITARKEQERKIARLSRIQAVLSGINTLIVRARDRDELFREACRIAVDAGAFKMAWIGVIDPETLEGKVIAWHGVEQDYIDQIRLTAREGTPDSERPACRAVRQLQPVISNDIATDPSLIRVRDDLVRKGRKSLGCFPLMAEGRAQAVITLFAGETDAFDEEEMQLLLELAGNISFALDHIEKERKLNYLAYYDALTGLANRNLFLDRVAHFMRIAASGGHKLALFLIDLERFKNINDSLGRPAGDALLKQVAEWLTINAGGANLLARVGPDHFAVVLPDVRQQGDVAHLVEKSMAALLEHRFHLNDAVFRVAHKVGAALFPDDGVDADTLFRNAEAALKKAKSRGDRYLFYTQAMTEAVAGRLTLENQLRQALEKEEFVLYYQPKVNLVSGQLTGAEALIRWNDPRKGLVPPGQFIPILEETGLIYEVGRWALRKAIDDYLRLRSAGLAAVPIAVNVSPLQLRHRDFIFEIMQAIGVDARAPAALELEITESLIMEDVKHNIENLREIRAMGVSIAIDDFGTGFSSLSYLAKLPVDTLKIDRSFVSDMTASPEGLALVSTIINLTHALKLKVVAEGVETEEQSRLLRLLNCDEMQGYLFSKPVPVEIFETRFLALPPPSHAN